MGPTKKGMGYWENSGSSTSVCSTQSGLPVSVSTAESDALSNHVVLKQIFLLLENKFLLEVSLVNKVWCYSARSVLRNHRKCLARLAGRNPCTELFELNEILSNSSENPYSGLIFRTRQKLTGRDREIPRYLQAIRHACIYITSTKDQTDNNGSFYCSLEPSRSNETSATNIPYTCTSILEKLTLRHLEIYWDAEYTCPAQGLLRQLLTLKREQLVELKIVRFPDTIPCIVEHLGIKIKDWLPNLKILDFYPECKYVWNMLDCQRALKYDFIQASPRLEEQLGINDHYDLQYFLDNNKVHVMKHFCITKQDFFDVRSDSQLNRLVRFGLAGPKLTKILIDGYFLDCDQNSAGHKAMTDFLRLLFKSVHSSLEEMRLDQHMLIKPVGNNILEPFHVLRELTLGLCWSFDQRIGFPTLERFDWGRYFPALETVICSGSHYSFDDDNPITNHDDVVIEEQLREILLQRSIWSPCTNVQKIVFEENLDKVSALGYFGGLFPNVKEFSCRLGTIRLGEIFEFLWTTWPGLESITLCVREYAVVQNLDAKLCGISEEEADSYRQESPDSLRSKELSPVAPSMLSFQRLKRLRLEIRHALRCRGDMNRFPTRFFLTHVTGILALSRMPGFEMEVVRQRCHGGAPCEFHLEHLRPFAKLLDFESRKM